MQSIISEYSHKRLTEFLVALPPTDFEKECSRNLHGSTSSIMFRSTVCARRLTHHQRGQFAGKCVRVATYGRKGTNQDFTVRAQKLNNRRMPERMKSDDNPSLGRKLTISFQVPLSLQARADATGLCQSGRGGTLGIAGPSGDRAPLYTSPSTSTIQQIKFSSTHPRSLCSTAPLSPFHTISPLWGTKPASSARSLVSCNKSCCLYSTTQ